MKPSHYILNTSKSQKQALRRMIKALDWYLCIEDIKAIEKDLNTDKTKE